MVFDWQPKGNNEAHEIQHEPTLVSSLKSVFRLKINSTIIPANVLGSNPSSFDISAAPMEEEGENSDGSHDARLDDVTSRQAYYLYVSHALSMWNSRTYEFAVVRSLFQDTPPGKDYFWSGSNQHPDLVHPNRLPWESYSVFYKVSTSFSPVKHSRISDNPYRSGIAETGCVLLFSSALGRWVDRTPSRLRAILMTINTNRIAVLVSCTMWFLLLSFSSAAQKQALFGIALVLGMVEKLSRGTNILSMERDWIPTLANPTIEGKTSTQYDLTHLNTVTRRIDMLCKLVAPLAVSTFISAIGSERIAVAVVAIISTMSWGLERWCLRQVWHQNGRLRAPKELGDVAGHETHIQTEASANCFVKRPPQRSTPSFVNKLNTHIRASIHAHIEGGLYYFSTPVWIPSVCAAIPHASVLTFSGTMITYLLNAGFSLNLVTVARASGAVFEIGSTFLFPYAVAFFSRTGSVANEHGLGQYQQIDTHDGFSEFVEGSSNVEYRPVKSRPTSSSLEHSVATTGSWAICGLFVSLVRTSPPFHLLKHSQLITRQIPAISSLFYLDSVLSPQANASTEKSTAFPTSLLPLLILIPSISLSLLFRWTYDLSATQLTQTLVPASHRSSFGGTEMAIVSVLSLTHWIAAAVWHAQRDFRWLATGSFVLVGGATGWYGWWYRRGGGSRLAR